MHAARFEDGEAAPIDTRVRCQNKTPAACRRGGCADRFPGNGQIGAGAHTRRAEHPASFGRAEKGIGRFSAAMEESAKRLDALHAELHAAGGHLQNAGRALSGKSEKEHAAPEADKGALAKLRGFLESCGRTFARMERGADRAAASIRSAEQKKSVKAELNECRRANRKKQPEKQEPER